MMQLTKIPWADYSANPVDGLCPVGCPFCYERRRRERFHLDPTIRYKPDAFKNIEKKPPGSRIFVGSIIDLFADEVPFEWINKIFVAMLVYSEYTFTILTKRPKRLAKFIQEKKYPWHQTQTWPYPNVELGVSVTCQADMWRVDELLKIPAAVRIVSHEPAIGPVIFEDRDKQLGKPYLGRDYLRQSVNPVTLEIVKNRVDWVIMGAMSGPGATPMKLEWARDVRDQCKAAGVPFFMKAVSGKGPIPPDLMIREYPK